MQNMRGLLLLSLLTSVSNTLRSYYKCWIETGNAKKRSPSLSMETDGTVGKRIWLAARLTDKWACKSAQPLLLESENISVAAGDVYMLIRSHAVTSM